MKFKVKNDSKIVSLIMILNIFFLILNILYTIFTDDSIIAMYSLTILIIFLPSLLCGLWLKNYMVIVNNKLITVRNMFGIKYSFNVEDITKVKWIIAYTKFGYNENIRIKTKNNHKFSCETLMINSDKMIKYLKENVDENKIVIKEKNYIKEG